MDTILALREKRKNLWDAAKAFLDMARDENGMVSAEDAARYDKMEEDVVNLGKEIDRLERQQQLDAQLAQPTSSPITEQPGARNQVPEKKGRASMAYQKAFWDSIRHKNFIDVQNALSVGTDADGGYLVPDEFEHQLIDKLQEENFFRSLATVIHTSGDRKIPVVTGHGEASWMEENGLYPDSQDTFGQQSIGAYKLGTAIRVSEELLNDSVFDLESYIAGEFARRIGTKEEEAFLIGDGRNKPTGVFPSAELGVTANGASITFDDVIDLYHSLRIPYRRKAVWLLNDATIKALRKIKDIAGIDLACEPTALMMQAVAGGLTSKHDQRRPLLERFGYLLGRFIYICDALDDLPDDHESGSYNPLLAKFPPTEGINADYLKKVHAFCDDSINFTLGEMADIYVKLDLKRYRDILDNIVYLGLKNVYTQIRSGKFRNNRKGNKDQ